MHIPHNPLRNTHKALAHSNMRVLAVVLSLALAHAAASEQVYRRAASNDVSIFELAKQVKSLDAEFSAGIAAAVDALGDHAKAASMTYVDTNINLLKGTVDTNIARCVSANCPSPMSTTGG